MGMAAKVGAALQHLLGAAAEDAGKITGVIVRRRKFCALSLARTFILGYLENPKATDEDLAQMAATCGIEITAQGVEQRFSEKLVAFLETMFGKAIMTVVDTEKTLAPLLERFTEVKLLDSSCLTLPDSQQERFPGCGGSHGSGKAALKLQTELELRGGQLTVQIESGRSADGATDRQHVARPVGSLRISDLGYFCLSVFAAMAASGAHFLSRLQFGTGVSLPNGGSIHLLSWLAKRTEPLVDVWMLVGKTERLRCRLIAWRLPPEQANRRRQKLRQETMRKRGYEPSAERLAWCDYTILVTSVPLDLLAAREAIVLYRARWQIELLFKRWKSQGCIAELSGSTEVRQMVRLWARLLAVIVQHWLVTASAWGDPVRSLWKTCKAVRKFAGRLLASLDRTSDLECVIGDLLRAIASTCKRNKRSKPGTFELLNDPQQLEFSLT